MCSIDDYNSVLIEPNSQLDVVLNPRYIDKVFWRGVSINENAIHILEQNLYKVDWFLEQSLVN